MLAESPSTSPSGTLSPSPITRRRSRSAGSDLRPSRRDATPQATSTATASRSASKTASLTSPRSSPSACSGSGSSQQTSIRSRSWPRRTPGRRRRGRGRGRAAEAERAAAPADALRRDEVEAQLEARLGRKRSGHRPGVGEDRVVRRRARTRRGRDRAISSRGSKPRSEQPARRSREGEVAGPPAVVRRAQVVDSPHGLGVDADARPRTRSAGRSTRPSEIRRVRRAAIRRAAAPGSRGRPSARGSTFVPPPGTKPSGTPTEGRSATSLNDAVAAEHARARRRRHRARAPSRDPAARCAPSSAGARRELALDESAMPLLGDPARERVDDQRRACVVK